MQAEQRAMETEAAGQPTAQQHQVGFGLRTGALIAVLVDRLQPAEPKKMKVLSAP